MLWRRKLSKPLSSLSLFIPFMTILLLVKIVHITPHCPSEPEGLNEQLEIDFRNISLVTVERKHPELSPGGRWKPKHCRALSKVAIIIPYRDRPAQLPMFLNHMHPFLQHQFLEYVIYVVEQTNSSKFNKAMLMNIGFVEANRLGDYDCFVFHDVDLLPENEKNHYDCTTSPKHMSVEVNKINYNLRHRIMFGGVVSLTKAQFEKANVVHWVNGFSNKFFGWGGEDDDLYNRVVHHGFNIFRYPAEIARYSMMTHKAGKGNKERYRLLQTGKARFQTDGINSLVYESICRQLRPLYTHFMVDINTNVLAS